MVAEGSYGIFQTGFSHISPLIIIAVLLILKPHYLFPAHGEIDFHLVRAVR